MTARTHRESEAPTVARSSPLALVEARGQAFARLPVLFDEADDRLDTGALVGGVVAGENQTVLMPSAPRLLATKPLVHYVIRPAPTPMPPTTRRPSVMTLAAISGTTMLVAIGAVAGIVLYLFG